MTKKLLFNFLFFFLILLLLLTLLFLASSKMNEGSMKNQYMNDNSNKKQFTFTTAVNWFWKDIIKFIALLLFLNLTQASLLTIPQKQHLWRICAVSALLNFPLIPMFKLRYRKQIGTLCFCFAWTLKDYFVACLILSKSRKLMPLKLAYTLHKLGYTYITNNLFLIFFGSYLATCLWIFFFADTEILNHYATLNYVNCITWIIKDCLLYKILKHNIKAYLYNIKFHREKRYLQLQDFAGIFWLMSSFNWVWVLLFSLLDTRTVQAIVICSIWTLKDYMAYAIVFYYVYPWLKIEPVSYAYLTPNYKTFITVLLIPILIDALWAYFFVATNEFEE